MFFNSPTLTLAVFVLAIGAALYVRRLLIAFEQPQAADEHDAHRKYAAEDTPVEAKPRKASVQADPIGLISLGIAMQQRSDWLVVRPSPKAKMLLITSKTGETLYRITPKGVFNMAEESVSHSEFLRLLREAPQPKAVEPHYEDDYYYQG